MMDLLAAQVLKETDSFKKSIIQKPQNMRNSSKITLNPSMRISSPI